MRYLLILVLMAHLAQGQTDSLGFSYTVNIDGYYRYAASGLPAATSMILEHNAPGLGFINVDLNYTKNKFGAQLNLAAGPRATQFYAADNQKVLHYIRRANIYYMPTERLEIGLGTKASFAGYEYDEPQLNYNFSNSFLSSFTPATFTGFWAEASISERLSFMQGVYADTDHKIDVVKGVHSGSMLSYTSEKVSASVSYYAGVDSYGIASQPMANFRNKVFDVLIDVPFGKNNIGFEYLNTTRLPTVSNLANAKMSGVNLYLTRNLTEMVALTLRSEYIKDVGVYFETLGNFYSFTATGKLKKKNFYVFPELRYDLNVFDTHPRDLSFVLGFGFLIQR